MYIPPGNMVFLANARVPVQYGGTDTPPASPGKQRLSGKTADPAKKDQSPDDQDYCVTAWLPVLLKDGKDAIADRKHRSAVRRSAQRTKTH